MFWCVAGVGELGIYIRKKTVGGEENLGTERILWPEIMP